MASQRQTTSSMRPALRNTTNQQANSNAVFRTKAQMAQMNASENVKMAKMSENHGRRLNAVPLRNNPHLLSAANIQSTRAPLEKSKPTHTSRPLTRGMSKNQSTTSTSNLHNARVLRPAAVVDQRMPSLVRETDNTKENVDPSDVHMASVERQSSVRSWAANSMVTGSASSMLTDPFLCPDYIDDIYAYLHHVEKDMDITRHYLSVHKTELKSEAISHRMRGITVDWLAQVSIRFQLGIESLFLAVQLLDRFLSRTLVPKSQLQLAAITCLMTACKYEEVSTPSLDDYVYLTANSVSDEEILEFERAILRQLEFNLGRPISIYFVRRYSFVTMATNEVHTTAKYLSEMMLMDYTMCHLAPSKQAAAATWIARFAFAQRSAKSGAKPMEVWPSTLVAASGLSEEEVTPYSRQLAMHVVKMETQSCKTKTIRTKYESSQYRELIVVSVDLLQRIADDLV